MTSVLPLSFSAQQRGRRSPVPRRIEPVAARQQRGHIDALYELVERVGQKVDSLDRKVDRRFDEISGQLAEVLQQLRDR